GGTRLQERPVGRQCCRETGRAEDRRRVGVPTDRLLAGRYQLESPLGRGTFGEVWRARDVTTRRWVAVKIVELGEIPDAPFLAEMIVRFRREAITAGELRHPNIVAAYEAGRISNELFLAMELMEGA